MKRSLLKALAIVCLIAFSTVTLIGCAGPRTKRQEMTTGGAVLGAAGGAIAGALLGDFKGALWGAGIGAVVGGIAGNQVGRYMEEQEQEFQRALAYERDASIRREGEILVATYKNDMLFGFDSADIKPGAYPSLDKTANILKRYENTMIQIEGHTDSVGSEEYNMDLSIRRALSVRTLLVQEGVADYRMETVGWGETRPVATNATAVGRQMNRRVEIRIAPRAE